MTSAGPVGSQPVVNHVSPLVAQQSSSEPTEVGGGAVGLPPAYVDTYDLTFPGSLMGVAGPPAVPLLPEVGGGSSGPSPGVFEYTASYPFRKRER